MPYKNRAQYIAYHQQYREKNKDRIKLGLQAYYRKHADELRAKARLYGQLHKQERKNRALKYAYEISLADYLAMATAQKHKCAICDIKYSVLFVDHNHRTGKVRGLLCMRCNSGLGHFKDDIQRLTMAISYLKEA